MELTRCNKCSEVGLIPVDWNAKEIGSLADKVGSGLTPTGGGRVYRTSGRPFIRSQNVGWGHLDLNDIVFIDDATHSEFDATEIHSDDVFLNITGASIGRSAVADSRVAGGNVNQHVCIIRPKHDELIASFLSSFLVSTQGQNQIASFQAGGNRQGLNFRQVRSIRIAVPPSISEQRAIADALGDVDALLDGLDRLIAKKRDLKQAAMQQLLTGQTRLPGFSGEWEVARLGTVMQFQVGFPFNSVHFNQKSQGIRLIKNRDLKSDDQIFHYDGSFDPSYLVGNGDVLVGMDGDFVPCCWLKGQALLNQRVGRILTKTDLNPIFAFYALRKSLEEIEVATAGTTVKHLSHGDVEAIEKPLPSIAEQTAIATILSDVDAEIAALDARRTKTRDLKQAMMQELLTGKTRLI